MWRKRVHSKVFRGVPEELYSKSVGSGGNHGSIFFLCCTGCNFLTLQ